MLLWTINTKHCTHVLIVQKLHKSTQIFLRKYFCIDRWGKLQKQKAAILVFMLCCKSCLFFSVQIFVGNVALSVLYSVITPHAFYVKAQGDHHKSTVHLNVVLSDSEKVLTKTSNVFGLSAGNRGTTAGASTYPEVRLFWTSGTRSQTTQIFWSRTAPHWVRESFHHTLLQIKAFKWKSYLPMQPSLRWKKGNCLLELATYLALASSAGMNIDYKFQITKGR